MPRYSLRTLLIVLAVAPIVLFALTYGVQVIWDGAFPLEVHFINETGQNIRLVEAAVVGTRKDADFFVSASSGAERPNWKPVNLDQNDCAYLTVRCSGHVNSFTGHELSYYQQSAFVTRVEFGDGSESVFATDVPPRGVRTLEVKIPHANATP